jgi:ethanolamine utilization protein EutQ (cupin superfamily)
MPSYTMTLTTYTGAIMNEKEDEVLDDFLRMRINSKQFDTYKDKVKRLTGVDHHNFTRDLITAFNEGRITITLSNDQKQLFGETYHVD